jgi:hypothetical protein
MPFHIRLASIPFVGNFYSAHVVADAKYVGLFAECQRLVALQVRLLAELEIFCFEAAEIQRIISNEEIADWAERLEI